jgi:hypothetical protein
MKLLSLLLCSVLCFGFAIVSGGCGGSSSTSEAAPEPPPTRGQRDRVMSELHGSRKLLGDAIEAAVPAKFSAGSEDAASPATAVAALIQMEQGLLDALQNSTPVDAAHPTESDSLSREERQRLNEESAAAMRKMIDGCIDRIPASGMKASADAASASPEEMLASFRSTRDNTILYARETEHSFLRRKIDVAACGSVDLMTGMMLHAELTSRVADYVRERGR